MSRNFIVRHALLDRLLHWLFALLILVLLATGLLPVFGIRFDWVTIHWVSGVLMTLLLVLHILRSVFQKSLRSMWVSPNDLRRAKPGKYSLPQKMMHNVVALLGLAAVITGLLMMVRISTPFWERNPYWLQPETWGMLYVAHGLAAIVFVSVIMLHIYFSLRPEKRMYLRSMISGKVDEQEYRAQHQLDVTDDPRQ